MTTGPRDLDPDTVYANAPDILSEISWVTGPGRLREAEEKREILLRNAALCDRIALRGAAHQSVPDTITKLVENALFAAYELVEHDIEHRGLSLRASELVTSQDYRDYVRQEYLAWSRAS
ncbi:hypothetical protein CTZ27_34465 [Streptomyces griseocarneus]|nr:hypothetical protein CTZ27_34465 [Streptomyces griseocarneus]